MIPRLISERSVRSLKGTKLRSCWKSKKPLGRLVLGAVGWAASGICSSVAFVMRQLSRMIWNAAKGRDCEGACQTRVFDTDRTND